MRLLIDVTLTALCLLALVSALWLLPVLMWDVLTLPVDTPED